jgi:hypothetical protein
MFGLSQGNLPCKWILSCKYLACELGKENGMSFWHWLKNKPKQILNKSLYNYPVAAHKPSFGKLQLASY